MALERPRITYDEFIDSLRTEAETDETNLATYAYLNRKLTRQDVESDTVVSWIYFIPQDDVEVLVILECIYNLSTS
jgi:hypothetical protein